MKEEKEKKNKKKTKKWVLRKGSWIKCVVWFGALVQMYKMFVCLSVCGVGESLLDF